MTRKKSYFLVGNVILLLATATNPTVVGAAVNDAIRATPLSAPEIVQGLAIARQMLDIEKSKDNVDKNRLDVLGEIQQSLMYQAEVAGLTLDNNNMVEQRDLFDAGLGTMANETTSADEIMADRSFGGGSLADTPAVHAPAIE